MHFPAKIDKNVLNDLQTVVFEGKIEEICTTEQAQVAIQQLNTYAEVGIDTETRPSFKKGTSYPVSLLQVSTLSVCYLFRLNQIKDLTPIGELFENKNVKKIGLSLSDDLRALTQRIRMKPKECFDIQNMVKDYGIFELSLQKIFAIVFNRKISKAQRLSNWEQKELTNAQQLYAATDAWATLLLYAQLKREKKISQKEKQTIEAELAKQEQERLARILEQKELRKLELEKNKHDESI